jgi:hypothetical protein
VAWRPAERRDSGVTVAGQYAWNVFDPRVIRWRLAGDPAAAEQAMRDIITEATVAMLPDHDDR